MDPLKPALDALALVKRTFPGAIIAGGFLRDAFFGRQKKDIDIFVPFDADERTSLSMELDGFKRLSWSGYMVGGEVEMVWELKDSDSFGYPVQVIMLRAGLDVEERARAHDFDFCQVWHDGTFWRESLDFASRNMYEVTLVHCESQKEFDRSMRRWERLKQKYPDMTLVIPERFAMFKDSAKGSLPEASCICCKKPFVWGQNVYSEAGRREVSISRLCETCFDGITKEPEDYL